MGRDFCGRYNRFVQTCIICFLANWCVLLFYRVKGICKLPFIDEERLLTEMRKIENKLTINICFS